MIDTRTVSGIPCRLRCLGCEATAPAYLARPIPFCAYGCDATVPAVFTAVLEGLVTPRGARLRPTQGMDETPLRRFGVVAELLQPRPPPVLLGSW